MKRNYLLLFFAVLSLGSYAQLTIQSGATFFIQHPDVIECRKIEHAKVAKCLVEAGILFYLIDEGNDIDIAPDHHFRKRDALTINYNGGIFLGKTFESQQEQAEKSGDYSFHVI